MADTPTAPDAPNAAPGAHPAHAAQQDPSRLVDAHGVVVTAAREAPPWLACDLQAAPVPELVNLLIAARRTGRLDVVDRQGTRSMYFESGELIGTASTHQADRLGEVLWRSERLSLDQLVIATEMMKSEGKLLGRVLLELGFLEPAELRKALIEQAINVFEAAALEEHGYAVFFADVFPTSPLRFGVGTKTLVERSLVRAREHRELVRRIGSLDRPCALAPAGSGDAARLDEPSQAVLQLVASAKGGATFTGRELIEKAKLGRHAGTRALLTLFTRGLLVPKATAADDTLRIKRLCAAINLVMAALDDAGFGVGDLVREYVEHPPGVYEDALSGLTLERPLEDDAVLQHAAFIGVGPMATALQAVLDDALGQATDTLDNALVEKLRARVRALG